MNHRKNKSNSKVITSQALPSIRLFKKNAVLMGLITVIVVVAGVFIIFSKQLIGRQAQADYKKLIGDWGRPDGDYIIRISSIYPDGQVHAAYFNPNPINVGQANASFRKNAVNLFVELRDQGYPGSKYNLTYNPGKDILEGTYFQAQIQQYYDVIFQRIR